MRTYTQILRNVRAAMDEAEAEVRQAKWQQSLVIAGLDDTIQRFGTDYATAILNDVLTRVRVAALERAFVRSILLQGTYARLDGKRSIHAIAHTA